MYDDPTHIRDREIKLRLNDAELDLVDALARYNQRQRATFIRELLVSNLWRSPELGLAAPRPEPVAPTIATGAEAELISRSPACARSRARSTRGRKCSGRYLPM